jgi:hypothetical protein
MIKIRQDGYEYGTKPKTVTTASGAQYTTWEIDEGTKKWVGKWQKVRINLSFIEGLRKYVGRRHFTNKEAYDYYAKHHAQPGSDKTFMEMTVRNNLCKLAYIGVTLKRVGPGRYHFTRQ